MKHKDMIIILCMISLVKVTTSCLTDRLIIRRWQPLPPVILDEEEGGKPLRGTDRCGNQKDDWPCELPGCLNKGEMKVKPDDEFCEDFFCYGGFCMGQKQRELYRKPKSNVTKTQITPKPKSTTATVKTVIAEDEMFYRSEEEDENNNEDDNVDTEELEEDKVDTKYAKEDIIQPRAKDVKMLNQDYDADYNDIDDDEKPKIDKNYNSFDYQEEMEVDNRKLNGESMDYNSNPDYPGQAYYSDYSGGANPQSGKDAYSDYAEDAYPLYPKEAYSDNYGPDYFQNFEAADPKFARKAYSDYYEDAYPQAAYSEYSGAAYPQYPEAAYRDYNEEFFPGGNNNQDYGYDEEQNNVDRFPPNMENDMYNYQ